MNSASTIVVPVYKKYLNEQERISLRQLKRILGRYPIVFVAPESLTVDYGDLSSDVRIQRFPDVCFSSIINYSRMLMSCGFYEKFLSSEYILIYQLDAFVFSDRLDEFCKMDYDYIGAPIPRICWSGMPGRVGNGGVSLRRVRSMLRLLSEHGEMRLPETFASRWYYRAEDAILSYWLSIDKASYQLPPVNVAADFALDQDVQHRFARLNEERLPFACHGWQRATFPVWRRFIEAQGHDLSYNKCSKENLPIKMKAVMEYMTKRICNLRKEGFIGRTNSVRNIVNSAMSSKKYAIWGFGRIGRRALATLQGIGISVDIIYDNDIKMQSYVGTARIIRPSREKIVQRRRLVIITSSAYEHEIAKTLASWGLLHGWDYVTFEEFLLPICKEYLSRMAIRYRK